MTFEHTGFLSIVQGEVQGFRNAMNLTALQDGGFFAVWHESNSSTDAYDIYGQRFDALGAPMGPPIILNADQADFQRNPDVTQLSDGTLIVVWQSFGQEDGFIGTVGYGVYAQRLDVDGTPLSDAFHVNTQTRDDQINPQVIALNDGGFLIQWRETDYPGPEILLRRYDSDAVPAGDPFMLDDIGDGSSILWSLVQAPDGRLLATYQIFDETVGRWDTRLGQFDLDGTSVVPAVTLGDDIPSSFNPAARITLANDGSFVVTLDFTSVNDLYLIPFGADGLAQGVATPLDADYNSPYFPQSAFLPDGRLIMTYSQLFEAGARGVILNGDLSFDGTYFDVSYGYQWEYGAQPNVLESGALVLQWWNDAILGNADTHFTQTYFDDPVGSSAGFTEARDVVSLPETGANVAALGGSDSVTGGAAGDTIWGDAGNDTLIGGGGNDVVDGGAGADNLTGGNGVDRLYGAAGADTLIGGDDGDVLDGGRGTDWLQGGGGNDFLTGGGEADTLDGGDGDDTLLASDTNGSTLWGGDGHDILIGSTDADLIDGGLGDDTLVGNRAGPQNIGGIETAADTLIGGAGNDLISGGGTGALLDGGDGDDRLTWLGGQGTVDGGAGEDTLIDWNNVDLDSEFRGARVEIDLTAGTVSDTDGTLIATVRNIEHVDMSLGDHPADITGDAGDNLLLASTSYTTINGRAGNDEIGGWGVLNGGSGDDTIWGRERDDRLLGGDGNDVLITQVRQDTLYGRDVIRGGEGFDILVIDPVYNNGSVEYVEVNLSTGLVEEHGYWETPPVIEGLEGVQVLGDLRADLIGDAGDNLLIGGDLNDTLSGGAGADTLIGGEGHDIADYTSATLSVRVDLQNPAISYNDAAGDTFDGIEEFQTGDGIDQLRGDAGDNIFRTGGVSDRLYGRAGDDMLFGEAGADAFYGGLGADIMTGGDDAGRRDRYIYFNAAESGVGDGNRDVITDFVAGEDRIEISRIDADLTTGGKQGFDFIGDTAFSGTGGELRYEQVGGNTIVQADRDGDGAADFEIELTGTMDLTESDFLI